MSVCVPWIEYLEVLFSCYSKEAESEQTEAAA